jgi:hypothetical protein
MAAHGLQGAFLRKRWRCSTRQDPRATPAPDLVDRNFTAQAPNRLWVADISRIGTGEGRCGWPVSGMGSRGGSWAGRPATGSMSSWCWARWSMPSGAAAWTVILPSVGSSTTATVSMWGPVLLGFLTGTAMDAQDGPDAGLLPGFLTHTPTDKRLALSFLGSVGGLGAPGEAPASSTV